MDRKKLIVIILLVCILGIVIFCLLKKDNTQKNNNESDNTVKSSDIQLNYNNESGLYEIVDKTTGEVIATTMIEEEGNAQLEFYKNNPDYRATPPATSGLDEN